ncbi:MAG: helix-turn-helix transcriptional regulator [Clostridia bacterium]
MKFNEKIIMLRKNKNLSQEDLGNELGVARQTISKWELGETTPEMDKLIKMSEIFEITLDDLIKDTEPNIDKNNDNNTNTQKLAGLVIKILKGIGIFIIIVFAITVIMMIMGLVFYNNMKYDSKGVVEEIEENIIMEEER